MKYLRNLLPSQANLGNVLPLLGMLFRIPINILPLPSLFYDDENCTQNEENKVRKRGEGSGALEEFIDLKECSGPDLSDDNMKEYTLPLLEIIFECLISSKAIPLNRNIVIDHHHKYHNNNDSTSYDTSNNISNNDDDRNDNDKDTGNQTENIGSNNANEQIHKEYVDYERMKYILRDTILKTLSHGFFTLSSFRLLMQRKKALQNLLTSLLFYHDSAAINNDKLVHFDHSLPGPNLPGKLNENHFSLRMTSSPSIDKNMNNSNHNNNYYDNNNNDNSNMSSNGSNDNLSSLTSSNFANRKLERSKSLQKSDKEIFDIDNDSDRNLATSSPSNPANSLFKGSPNWDNLFESSTETLTSNSTIIQNQNQNQNQNHHQQDKSTHFIATEKEISGKYSLDEGKKLLTLISSIIFSGIIELENPSMIAALFLCLPSDDVNNEKHQLLIIDSFKNVVTDIFTDYYDSSITKRSQKVLLILSGVLNHLINLSRLNFFALSVKFELLQLTLKILEVSYEYKVIDKNRNILRDKEKEKERISALSISKDLGETGRCFACSCLEAVEDAEMKKFKKRNECLQGSNCSILLFIIIQISILLFIIIQISILLFIIIQIFIIFIFIFLVLHDLVLYYFVLCYFFSLFCLSLFCFSLLQFTLF